MQEAAGAHRHPPMPRVLIYTAALACGLLAALAVHIGLTAAGFGLGTVRDLMFAGKNQVNSALAWWGIGLAGCLGSLLAIVATRRLGRRGFGRLRAALAFVFVCILAVAGRKAAAPPGSEAATITAVNLAAMALGGFMAFFAAHFAARR